MKKTVTFLLVSIAAVAFGVTEPSAELVATSTNLALMDQVRVSLVVRLPPLGIGDQPLQVTCPFLMKSGKNSTIDFGDPNAPVVPEQMPRNNWRGPSFNLNGYAKLMVDPFGQRVQVPYEFPLTKVEREADKGWRLTIAFAPWRVMEPGSVRIDPVSVDLSLVTSRQQSGGFNYMTAKPVQLRTEPLVLTIAETPQSKRPLSWCGAVASNLTASVTLTDKVCKVGDPIWFTLEIAGASNPPFVRPPDDLASAFAGSNFRIDAASLKTETQPASSRFSWCVRALKAGTVEFPSIPVSYYDSGRRVYATCKTEPIPIQVQAGLQVVLMDDDEEFPQPDGIDLDPRGAEARPLLPHLTLAALLFLVPPVLFLCIRLAPPVRRRIAARNLAYRKARAFRICRRALRSRSAARRAGAISRFFTVRYGVNGAAVTAADAQRLMAPDYSEEDIALVVTNLQTHDAQTYSAKPGSGVVALLLAAGLSLVVGAAQDAADPARAEFYYKRASVLAVQAADEAGFAAAAKAYRMCLEAGANSACIYQNLGACLVMAGDTDGARMAFECAERRGGESPSTVRGLRAARAKQTNNPRAELSPARIFLKPHVYWNVDMRLLCAAALWAVFWMALLLPAGALRRALLLFSLAAFCATAASVGVSLVEERQSQEVFRAQN